MPYFDKNLFQRRVIGRKKDNESSMYRDKFGFKKLVILACETGKVAAIETLKGQVIWSYLFDSNLHLRWIFAESGSSAKFPPTITAVLSELYKVRIFF